MQPKIMNFFVIVSLSIFLVSGMPAEIKAAGYPERPVTFIVGFPPGGPADLVSRALIEAVKPYFPQTFIVVNRPGGNSTIGMAEIVRANPDGYTIGMGFSPSFTASPHQGRLPYQGPGDVKSLISIMRSITFFAVRGDAPWKTMEQLLEYAKANPGKIRAGSIGVASAGHVGVEGLNKAAKVDITHVPFEGASPMIAALLGGHIEAAQGNAGGAVYGLQKAGKFRFLAIYGKKRLAQFPEVPTVKELGYDIMATGALYYVVLPKLTPAPIIQKLYNSFKQAFDSEAFQSFMTKNAFVTEPMSVDELDKELKEHYVLNGEFLKTMK